MGRIHNPESHGAGQGFGIGPGIGNRRARQPAYGLQGHLCLLDQFTHPFLDGGVFCPIRLAQGILDSPARHARRLDHISTGCSVIGFGVPHDVDDIWPQSHLQVDAGSEVRARGVDIHRIAEQARTGLRVNAEGLVLQRFDRLEYGQHFCQVHLVGSFRRAVEHELGEVLLDAIRARIVSGQKGRDHEDHIRRIPHPPMVRLIQFNRDIPLPVKRHHLLMFADRPLQIPGTAPIHLVEPEQGDGAPGDLDRINVHLSQSNEIVGP